jgi:hypothetical protein
MNIQELAAKANAERERKLREAMERFKSSPLYQRMKEAMAKRAEKAE